MLNTVQALNKLQDYYARYRTLPSYSTLLNVFAVRSKSGVAKLIAELRESGHLKMTPDQRLAPTARFFERTVHGQVRAGLPDHGQEAPDFLNIDAYLVQKPSRSNLVRVRGDSMIDMGLLDGDFVVIEQNRHARIGEIVVAVIEGEQTVKILDQERGRFVLRPANAAYPVIRPQAALEIIGVVVGSCRSYH